MVALVVLSSVFRHAPIVSSSQIVGKDRGSLCCTVFFFITATGEPRSDVGPPTTKLEIRL